MQYTFVYVMVQIFFPVKILSSAPEMFFLFVFFFPVRDSNLLGDRASETTGSTA